MTTTAAIGTDSSMIDVNCVGTVKGADGKPVADQNAVFLFQHGINNAAVDPKKKGDEQFWDRYLREALARDPFFSPEQTDERHYDYH